MLLRVSWAEIVCIFALILLAGCQQSITGGVVVEQQDDSPKDVVITSQPKPVATQQPTAPQPVAPAPNWVPENVLPRQEKEVIIIPESKPSENPLQDCLDSCSASCESSSSLACSQTTGYGCKQNCGSIIDPSACSTACSLRDARKCEPKFIEFCTSTCEGRCH